MTLVIYNKTWQDGFLCQAFFFPKESGGVIDI